MPLRWAALRAVFCIYEWVSRGVFDREKDGCGIGVFGAYKCCAEHDDYVE